MFRIELYVKGWLVKCERYEYPNYRNYSEYEMDLAIIFKMNHTLRKQHIDILVMDFKQRCQKQIEMSKGNYQIFIAFESKSNQIDYDIENEKIEIK